MEYQNETDIRSDQSDKDDRNGDYESSSYYIALILLSGLGGCMLCSYVRYIICMFMKLSLK